MEMDGVIKGMLYGRKIVLSNILTHDGEPFEVKRTWKERLFTKPWRPFKKTRIVVLQIPDDVIIKTPDAYIMHPEVFKRLQLEFNKQ